MKSDLISRVGLGLGVFGLALAGGWFATKADAAPLPPSAGLVLSLNANQGVTTNVSGVVTGWTDETTNFQWIQNTVGTPTLANGTGLPNGITSKVINFNGASGLGLNNSSALSLQNLNIFVLGDTTANQTSGEFITNYHNNGQSNGWAVGNSDSNAGQLKWFTGPDGSDTLGGTTGLAVTPGTYYLINMQANPATGKYASIANQTTFQSNSEATYGNGANTIPYDGSEKGGIGFLNASTTNGIQQLNGNIAEILVYNDAGLTPTQIAAQTSAVEAYFVAEFSTPEPSTVMSFIGMGAMGLVIAFRYRRRGTAEAKV